MAAELALHERPEDQGLGRAVALAIGLHLLLALLAWLSSFFDWQREPPSAKGLPVMNADLGVSASEAAAARQALQQPSELPPEPQPEPEPEPAPAPAPQPIPEPIPEQAPVERQVQAQERIPVPDTESQDEVREQAISAEKREREQEEKRRQEQIDLTERERQKQVEERQRLAQQAEAAKQKAEREKKLAQIRAERGKLQRQTQLAEQRLRQIADQRTQSASASQAQPAATGAPPPGNNGVDEGLLRQYIAAIQSAVTGKWTRPDNVPSLPCKMTIIQLPGGEVMDVQFDASCPYDEAGKRSVEAAVRKAQPLPYAGFESVFNRRLNFTFRPN